MILFDVHSFLKPVVEIATNVDFTNVVDNGGNNYTLSTTNTKHLRPPKSIEIGGNDYQIVDFIQDQSITIQGSAPIALDPFTLAIQPFQYWHGTVIQTNNERINIPDKTSSTPFVYFPETFTEDYGGIDDGYVEVPIRLFFLDESDFENYYTEDYYKYVINPMRSSCASFINQLYKTKGVMNIDDIKLKNHTRFATFINQQGYESNLFAETLSGVELECTIRVRQKRC